MTFEELILKQDDLLDMSGDCINSLKEEYDKEKLLKFVVDEVATNITNKKELLITLLNKKIDILNHIDYDNFEIMNQKLKKIDEKIYKQFYILRESLIKIENNMQIKINHEKSDVYFNEFKNKIESKRNSAFIKTCFNFFLKNYRFCLSCLLLVGALILFVYFRFYVKDMPSGINISDMLYYLILATLIGISLASFFASMFIMMPVVVNEIFKINKRVKKYPTLFSLLLYCPALSLGVFYVAEILNYNISHLVGSVYLVCIAVVIILFYVFYADFKRKDLKFENCFLLPMLLVMLCILPTCANLFLIMTFVRSVVVQIDGIILVAIMLGLLLLIFAYLNSLIQNKHNILHGSIFIMGIFLALICFFYPSKIAEFIGIKYSLNTLTLKSEARSLIPKECESFIEDANQSIKLKNPTVLSDIGKYFIIQMNCSKDLIKINHQFVK